jgi:hypothetical protein
MPFRALALSILALPLGAQAWDLRVEVPFPKGQNLPQTLLQGTSNYLSGKLDTGHGAIFTVNHRIIRVGPILKFDWGVEVAHWKSDGKVQQGSSSLDSRLKQYGFGVGVNAQFWVPFTGIAGEMGLIQRFQKYKFESADTTQDHDLSRTWLRVGARWRLPVPVISPYVAASYQQPLSKDRPVRLSSVADLSGYLGAQGSGQEFERMWTFGVGLQF